MNFSTTEIHPRNLPRRATLHPSALILHPFPTPCSPQTPTQPGTIRRPARFRRGAAKSKFLADLGLIYSLETTDEEKGKRVSVKMTLTVPGVAAANVELVWDPPWSPELISPAGRERLGME